ncbi:MAG: MFS transporter [Saprospiraceae bacterium]|nr:MFS transporter [Saprospiraceae bacterium]
MLRHLFTLYKNSFSGLSKDIWLLAFVSFVNRSGTMVLPFLTVYLTQELDFSKGRTGIVMGCFGMGSILGTYLGGYLTDRIGYYRVMFWTLFVSGLLFILLATIREFEWLCVAVFVLSMVADAFRPANISAASFYSIPANRTRSFSLLRLAVNLGFAVGPAVGGILAGTKGYSWLFWVDGLTCIASAILMRIFLAEKKEAVQEEPSHHDKPVAGSAYRDKFYLWFILITAISAFSFMQLFSTLPVFLKEDFLLNESEIGWLLALNGLLIAALEMPIVYSLESKLPPLRVIRSGTLLIGLSFWVFNFFPHILPLAIFAMVIITFGEILNMPFTNSFAVSRSRPENRGQYMALYAMAYSAAHVLAPIIGLKIVEDYGYSTLWHVLMGCCVSAAIGFTLLRQRMVRFSELRRQSA